MIYRTWVSSLLHDVPICPSHGPLCSHNSVSLQYPRIRPVNQSTVDSQLYHRCVSVHTDDQRTGITSRFEVHRGSDQEEQTGPRHAREWVADEAANKVGEELRGRWRS